MNPLQLVKSIMKNEIRTDSGMQSLKAGQVITGKILKLYPGQTAEVMVASQKIIAQLEIPLSADERYWFQVQPGEGKIHLKVLNQLQEGRNASSAESLLSQFGLSNSKDSLNLLNFMIKEKLPIDKAAIQTANKWIKEHHPAHEALAAIKVMSEKQLPFSKDIFTAILTLQNKIPTTELMKNINTLLNSSEQTETATKLQNLLTRMTMPEAEKIGRSAIPLLLNDWLSVESSEANSFKLLRAAGMIPEGENEESFLSVLSRQMMKNKSENVIQNGMENELRTQDENLPANKNLVQDVLADKKAILQSLNNSNLFETDEISANMNNRLLMLLSGKSVKMNEQFERLGNVILNAFNSNKDADPSLLKQETALKESLSSLLRSSVWDDGEQAFVEMKKLFLKMGYSFESDFLNTTLEQMHEKKDSLKPLLIRYLNENPPQELKEASEQLLNRMTGIQLLNHDSSPLQQTVMQIPIPFLNKTTDLTVQWSGKKLENGKIDPDYCRVLFYLDLEQIGETVVDMQVQNRILTLGILNERQDVKTLAEPFLKALKENLKRMDYHLSAITFDPPAAVKPKAQFQNVMPKAYNGVDIRI